MSASTESLRHGMYTQINTAFAGKMSFVLLSIEEEHKISSNVSSSLERQSRSMASIREYQSKDQKRLEDCILELQNFERALEPDRVDGESISARNLADLLIIVQQNKGQIFVVEVLEDVVGFVSVRLEHEKDMYLSTLTDYVYISDLVVLPPYRRQGYGTALLKRAEEFARQQGMMTLKIGVLAKNYQATAAYLQTGFRPYELILLKQLE